MAAPPHVKTAGRADAFRVFLRIGLLSFGGPAAQIALMHRFLVEDRKWLSETQYLNALSFCMLLPGPEAMQLATYAGWRLHGIIGGLIAGLLFVLPGAMVIFALAALYVSFGDLPLIATLFTGVQAAAVVIVLEALIRVSGRALREAWHYVVAALGFLAIFAFGVPFPVIVIAAGMLGAVLGARADTQAPHPLPPVSAVHTLGVVLSGLAVWAFPLVLVVAVSGPALLSDVGVFFSKLAVVTFGGAYAVLAYMAQEAVGTYGWLTPDEMMDGLGLAETTPGPLILVTQFVSFLAGFRDGGFGLAIWAATICLWVTFVPCFLWIFVGAPYIEWLTSLHRLNAALKGVTAAVVGVILNLSLWFALHVVFDEVTIFKASIVVLPLPVLGSADPSTLLLIALAAYLLLRRHAGIGLVLAATAVAALVICWI